MVALPQVRFIAEPVASRETMPHSQTAWTLFESGDYKAAIEEYTELLSEYPDNPELLGLIGIALFRLNRPTEASRYLDRALQAKPKDAALLNAYGAVLGSQNRNEEALRVIDESIRLKPSEHDAHHNRALALSKLGRFQEALTEIDDYLNRNPPDSDRVDLARLRKSLVEGELRRLAKSGFASWAGGKPKGRDPPIPVTPGPPVSDLIHQMR